jgi:hypothetical protein
MHLVGVCIHMYVAGLLKEGLHLDAVPDLPANELIQPLLLACALGEPEEPESRKEPEEGSPSSGRPHEPRLRAFRTEALFFTLCSVCAH